jgi:hypothetical protein
MPRQSSHSLAVLRINQPCHESWDQMTGDDRSRFCAHCQKHVHNLSAMSTDEAERLLCTTAGSLCVRFHATPEGKPVTLDYAPAPAGRRWLRPITTVAALAAGIVGCVMLNRPKPKPTPVYTLGMVAPINHPVPEPGTTTKPVGANEPCTICPKNQ